MAAVLAGCSQPQPAGDDELLHAIGKECAAGDYAAALRTAERLAAQRRAERPAYPCRVAAAERTVAELQGVLHLPAGARRILAEADARSLTAREIADTAAVRAVGLLEEGVALRRQVYGPSHPAVATALSRLGEALVFEAGEMERGVRVLHEAALMNREAAAGAEVRVWDDLALADACAARRDAATADSLYWTVVAEAGAVCGGGSKEQAAALSGLARQRADEGDFAAALPLYQRAVASLTESNQEAQEQQALVLHEYADVLLQLGEFPAAEDALRRVLRLDAASGAVADSLASAVTLTSLGWALDGQGKTDEAETVYAQGLGILRRRPGADTTTKALAENSLGALYMKHGRHAQAEALFRDALAAARPEGSWTPIAAAITLNLARELREQARFDEAEALYREALAMLLATRGNQDANLERVLYSYGSLSDDRGQFVRAESLYARAAGVYEASRLRIARGFQRAAFQETPYPKLANARLRLRQSAAAWTAAEQGQARVLVELLQAGGDAALSEAEAATRDSLCGQLDTAEALVDGAGDGAGSGDGGAADAVGSADAGAAGAAVTGDADARFRALLHAQSAWAGFQASLTARHPGTTGGTYSLAHIQHAIAADAALLGWLDVEERTGFFVSWVYVVRREGAVHWYRVTRRDSLASPFDLARRFQGALASGPGAAADPAPDSRSRGVRPSPRAGADDLAVLSQALYEHIRPAEPALRAVRKLIVVASGAMQGIPVECIRMPDGRLFGDRFEVSYAPSATTYAWLQARRGADPRAGGETRGALVVADPRFESTSTDSPELSRLPPLPASRREGEVVAQCIPYSTLLLGADAREAKIDDLLQSGALAHFKVLHIAAHAVADHKHPDRSKLVLTRVGLPDPVAAIRDGRRIEDGVITAAEIARDWRLRADLVTLSACATGLGQPLSGEGYVGLAQALLQAGARCVLVSLWAVDDEATSALMQRFYENLGVGDGGRNAHRFSASGRPSAPAALQEAKAWLRQTWRGGRASHPYFWGGFVLIGDASSI